MFHIRNISYGLKIEKEESSENQGIMEKMSNPKNKLYVNESFKTIAINIQNNKIIKIMSLFSKRSDNIISKGGPNYGNRTRHIYTRFTYWV
jgi:hypothetical protein